jgi:hypothetical protein
LTDRSSVHVLVFPADDVALRAEFHRAFAEVSADLPEARQIADIEDRLRRWYRSVEIRPRDPLGGYDDDPTPVWYVYRDGRIRARNERLERLYGALATARTTVRASEDAIGQARDVARRARYSEHEPVPEASLQEDDSRRVATR